MTKSCGSCGAAFESKRAAGRWCSDRCRKRAQRAPAPAVVLAVPPGEGELTEVTRLELQEAGRVDTSLGQAALLLARRLDSTSADTGSSLAALVREHRATLAEATRGLKVAGDLLDELKARRDRQHAG